MYSIHDISTGLQAWVAHAEAKMTLQEQEIAHLNDELEAARMCIPPHPFVPLAPVPERVLTLDIEDERE
jgi:hypothetical protein